MAVERMKATMWKKAMTPPPVVRKYTPLSCETTEMSPKKEKESGSAADLQL